jgi:uncharacterized protein (TIGR02145 family)
MIINKLIVLFILGGFVVLISCPEDEKEMLVRTGSVTEIKITTAKVSGEILDLGEGANNYGHCYATTANPTVAGTKTELINPVLGKYNSTLTGLSASTLYYVRAYISRGIEVVYGSDTSFTTASDSLPELTTATVTSIAKTSAVCGGNITKQGGTAVTARGVCWSLAKITTLTNNITNDGNGIGTFTSDIIGLTPGTNYYVRAYATNSGGTKLGNEVTFSTISDTPVPPTVTTTAVTSVTSNSAVCGGNVSSEGGVSVTERGVCWSISINPLITNYRTIDSNGSGDFLSNITGLLPGSTYYVRAYATNSQGTSYGSPEYTFITCRAPLATTNDATNLGASKATLNGQVNANSVNDSVTKITFEYGTTVSYGITVVATPDTLKRTSNKAVSAGVTGLTPNTVYHYRVKAVNCGGTIYGDDKTFTSDPVTITDVDGNVYNVIRIGNQLWMKENLKVIQFKNNSPILLVTDAMTWAGRFTPAYCWYNNDEGTSKPVYGALYNWHTVNTGMLCPTGWHIPSDAEWTVLTNYLGGLSVAGGKLREIGTDHWNMTITEVTNETGFTALPGGRRNVDGTFDGIRLEGFWWSTTEYDATTAWVRFMINYLPETFRESSNKKWGLSVRCVKD